MTKLQYFRIQLISEEDVLISEKIVNDSIKFQKRYKLFNSFVKLFYRLTVFVFNSKAANVYKSHWVLKELFHLK